MAISDKKMECQKLSTRAETDEGNKASSCHEIKVFDYWRAGRMLKFTGKGAINKCNILECRIIIFLFT